MTVTDIIIICAAVLAVSAGALLQRTAGGRGKGRHCGGCNGCPGTRTESGKNDIRCPHAGNPGGKTDRG